MKPLHTKRVAIVVTAVAVATLAWALAKPILVDPLQLTSGWSVLAPFLALIALTSVVTIAFLLLEHRWDRIAVITASWAAYILFWRPDPWYLFVLPVFGLAWYEGARRIRQDLRERREIRVRSSLAAGIKPVLLGIFIMLSLGFYLLPGSRGADLELVSQGIQGSFESAYQNPLVEARLAELPPSLQQRFRSDVAQTIDAFVRRWLGPVADLIPPLLAFALFLGLWTVNILFREPAIWLGNGIFAILKRTGFVSIEEKSVKAEELKI